MDAKEARSFAGKGVGRLQKRTPGWFEEWKEGGKDLNEECHLETKGCKIEEVMEAYPGQPGKAVSRNFIPFVGFKFYKV